MFNPLRNYSIHVCVLILFCIILFVSNKYIEMIQADKFFVYGSLPINWVSITPAPLKDVLVLV